MNKPITIMILLSYMIVLLSLMFRYTHILPTLLCLESLMLFLILYIPMTTNNQMMTMNFSIILMLTMSVSSTSMGLALLVTTSRKEGNDSTMAKTITSC